MTVLNPLAGGVFPADADGDDQLRRLTDDLGQRSLSARNQRHGVPDAFDETLWRNLENTGLARLTSTADTEAGPTELAVVLRSLAFHCGAVPIAETDLLAGWLAGLAGLGLPDTGPLTVAVADAAMLHGRLRGAAADVPWARTSSAIVLVMRVAGDVHVGVATQSDVTIDEGHNLAGEPRDRVEFDVSADGFRIVEQAAVEELRRRGAWARCVQIIGVLDAAAALAVAHTRERVQFGRALSSFQAVQHSLATMAGEIERARASATYAVAVAEDHGFSDDRTDHSVTAAKVVLGQVVDQVITITHQLHGAIGSTLEHRLPMLTMRAQSWIAEFGSTSEHARRLGSKVLDAAEPWGLLLGI